MNSSNADRGLLVRLIPLAILAAFSFVFIASTADAKVSPKTGVYVKDPSSTKPWGYVSTDKGKVTSASFYAKFKDSAGGCDPVGFLEYGAGSGLWGQSVTFKRPLKVNGKSKFSGKADVPSIAATIRVSGKFVSRNKAILTYSMNASGCKSSGTLKGAKFSEGG